MKLAYQDVIIAGLLADFDDILEEDSLEHEGVYEETSDPYIDEEEFNDDPEDLTGLESAGYGDAYVTKYSKSRQHMPTQKSSLRDSGKEKSRGSLGEIPTKKISRGELKVGANPVKQLNQAALERIREMDPSVRRELGQLFYALGLRDDSRKQYNRENGSRGLTGLDLSTEDIQILIDPKSSRQETRSVLNKMIRTIKSRRAREDEDESGW